MNIRRLNPSETNFSNQIASLINNAYDFDEAGFWKEGAKRTSEEEIASFIVKQEMVVAQDSNGKIIGCLRANHLDDKSCEIGMVSLDSEYRGKGIPSKMMSYNEDLAKQEGKEKVILELLVPREWEHPKKQHLYSWYTNRGYALTKKDQFEKYFPQAVTDLCTEVDFLVMEKNLKQTISRSLDLLETQYLNQQVLEQLFSFKKKVILVKNFASSDVCDQMAQKLRDCADREKYMYVMANQGVEKKLFLGVSRLGTPHSITFNKKKSDKAYKDYEKMALPMLSRIRSYAKPYLSPIDKLRLTLDENYMFGSNLANFEGHKMFSGIARYTSADAHLSAHAHVDSLTPDKAFDDQFAANIYLTQPEDGGELLYWSNHQKLTPSEVHDEKMNQYLWDLPADEAIKIKPEKGDLLLFSTQIPYAIAPFSKGERISLQTFIGKNKDQALQLWC